MRADVGTVVAGGEEGVVLVLAMVLGPMMVVFRWYL